MFKGEKMNLARTLFNGYLLLLVILCVNMGESKQPNSLKTVAYHQLKEKEGCFHATIHDDGNKIEVRNFSFAGYVTLSGVLKESDDSVNRLDVSEIKTIDITNRFYTSNRYKNLELLQVAVTTKNNKTITDLLVPRHIEISGIEISTQIQKAWSLSSIEKIIIQGPCNLINEDAEAKKFTEHNKAKEIAQKDLTPKHTHEANTLQVIPIAEPKQSEPFPPAAETTPTPQPAGIAGIWHALFNLIDAVIGIFKALISAIVGIFSHH